MTTHIKPLTAALVERILRREFPAGTFIRDPTMIGFAVRCGSTRASYIVESQIGKGGRGTRMTIATVGKMKLDAARLLAREKLSAMAHGQDIVAEHRQAKATADAERAKSTPTWTDALAMVEKHRKLKAATMNDYRRAVDNTGLDKRRLRDLTAADVAAIYRDLGEAAHASRTIRSLRAIWNVARQDDAALPAFPSGKLKAASKGWNATRRRRRVIADAMLPAWWRSVLELPRQEIRDAVAFMLWTGCRYGEMAKLCDRDVDLRAGVMTFKDTKSGRDVDLPIVTQLAPVLKRRLAEKDDDGSLFPQGDVHKAWESTLAVAPWSPHDLRRMFISACHRLGMDETVARTLTAHATRDDAHSGYIILPPDALRPHAQDVADFIERLCSGKVTKLRRAA